MNKRFLVFLFSVLFLLAGVMSPLAHRALSAPAPTPGPRPDVANEVQLAPAGIPTGFFIANSQWSMLNPTTYSATGAFQFWSWESLNPDRNLYRFDKIDAYIQAAINAGYQSVGIAITTYNGRTAQYYSCTGEFNQGYAQTPFFVRWGPDGIEGTADDPVVIADTPDTRDCDGDGVNDPWLLPKYTDPYYKQQYQAFVEAMAQHLLNSPYRNRIAWVAIGTGKDGENIPVNNSDDDALLRVISVTDWVNFVKDVITMYHDAFAAGQPQPQIPLLVQNAPFYRYTWERRDIASFAASKGVGVSVNGITSDFDLTEAGAAGNYIGLFDQIRQHGDSVPVALESYGYMMASDNEFYWAMARAVDLKPDFIRLSSFWQSYDTPANRLVAQWASRFIGKGLNSGQIRPPSVWSRMREHRDPIYLPYVAGDPLPAYYWPTLGNYEYFLTQDHEAPGGVTIPVTDDPRYQASDHRFGADQYPDVRSQPWHYNVDAYDSVLYSAGLYQVASVLSGRHEVQTKVDPGWTARRSDQASGNYGFFFDVDDRYLAPPADINTPHVVRITVTYLDHGTDRWRLMYDSVNGEKAATLYALRDWDVATGLAIEDGLPTAGVLPDPKPRYVQKTNTNQWKVATFYITDGYFGNRLPGGNDFYIDSRSDSGSMDGDEYIHHVDVQSLNDVPQVTPTPTSTIPTSTPVGPTPTPTATATPTPVTGGSSISGYVFESRNGDYTKDPDEPGIPGALISLYIANQTGSPLAQAVSDNNGYFRFTGVAANTYSLYVTPPLGWEMILGSRYIVVGENQDLTNQDFPARRVATPTATPTPTPTPTPTGGRIYGVVFEDVNGNGQRDLDEPGVADITVRLETLSGQLVDEITTTSDGLYTFNGLTPQTYHLQLQLPTGWTATTNTEYYLNPGNSAIAQDFGLQPPPPTPTPQPTGRFNAFVWNDLDKDGRRDLDEPPLAGATIVIYDSTGQNELYRKLTGGDGYARFDLPAPADYVVSMIPPWGMAASTPTEYSVVIRVDVELEIPFGSYDASKKVYLPQILRLGP